LDATAKIIKVAMPSEITPYLLEELVIALISLKISHGVD
jgi:hypothetical protein